MNNNIVFPDIIYEFFTEKEQIYQSLIEATIFSKASNNFIITMLRKLKEYKEKNGEELIIDILFMKYLKKIRSNLNIASLIQELNENNDINSQYLIAIKCFFNLNVDDKNAFIDQSWKLCTNDMIMVNGIKISKVISFYIYKKHFNYFTKEMIYLYKDNKKQILKNVNPYIVYEPKKIEENKVKYKQLMENINKFYSIDSWTLANIYKAIDNYIIDVNDNPYLFNAAACLCYKNPLFKVKFDITKLKLPDYITLDLIKLIRYEIPLQDLLEYKTYSIEIKNLCSFIYFLVLDQISFKDLEKYKDLISSKSYVIVLLVYMNYTNKTVPDDIYDFIISELNIHDSKDFLLLRIINEISKKNHISISDKNSDLLYALSKESLIKSNICANSLYGQMKKRVMNGMFNNINHNYIEKYKPDFLRFMKDIIKIFRGKNKINAIEFYNKIEPNDSCMKIEFICAFIDDGYYEKSYNLLQNLPPNAENIENLTNEFRFPNIKLLLNKLSRKAALEIIEKFKLKDKLNINDKMKIFTYFSLSTIILDIDRTSLLANSITFFNRNCMKNKRIKIRYVNEKGQDEGGLAKDWFTNVSAEIIEKNAFIPVPNGSKLTFNPCCDNIAIYEFIGKLLACAITNTRNINIKLASFIWKKIMDEKVTIDDMNDYDSEIYQSLKWISENDPEPLMMTFVDSNDEELCPNGKNIELNEKNKDQFINLIIENKLIKPNLEQINRIVKGFRYILSINEINILNSIEISELVEGKEIIDVGDWKKNTRYNDKAKYDEFFEIICNWSQENLKKLLKFVTGTSNVPFGGFSYYNNIGGLFNLEFSRYDSEYLPESHTCFNKVNIPKYATKEKFEQKLLLAIECDTFGFA